MMVSFGKPVAEPTSDVIQARRAMAIGSFIFDFSTSCSATFLRLCPCNRTRVVAILLAPRQHEYSGFVQQCRGVCPRLQRLLDTCGSPSVNARTFPLTE